MSANKIKYGLRGLYYAKATFDDDGNVSYATPVAMPGARSLSISAEGEPENWYADNIVYVVLNNNSGYTGDLELALIPESFLSDIMNESLDDNGVLAENTEATLEHFALLFQFEGDQKATRHVLYNCTASRPDIEGETIEDSKEPQTEKLSITAAALANGYVKAKTTSTTSDAVYNAWFTSVYKDFFDTTEEA